MDAHHARRAQPACHLAHRAVGPASGIAQRRAHVRQLLVVAALLAPLVVLGGEHEPGAVAIDQPSRIIAGPMQRPPLLSGEIGEPGRARCVARPADGGADQLHLDALLAPLSAHDLESHPDHPVCAQERGLLLHPACRQAGCFGVGGGEHRHLAVAVRRGVGDPHVVHRAARHQAPRTVAVAAQQRRLIRREVAGEGRAVRAGPPQLGQSLSGHGGDTAASEQAQVRRLAGLRLLPYLGDPRGQCLPLARRDLLGGILLGCLVVPGQVEAVLWRGHLGRGGTGSRSGGRRSGDGGSLNGGSLDCGCRERHLHA